MDQSSELLWFRDSCNFVKYVLRIHRSCFSFDLMTADSKITEAFLKFPKYRLWYFSFVDDILYVDNVKFFRAKSFNVKTFVQYYSCSQSRSSKCKAHAKIKYSKKLDVETEDIDDPWNHPEIYSAHMVSCSSLETHAKKHYINSMEIVSAKWINIMTKKVQSDPTLDPSEIYEAAKIEVLRGYPAEDRSEVLQELNRTKKDSHCR